MAVSRQAETAVIVIAGVGDNAVGAASAQATSSLLRFGGARFDRSTAVDETYAAAGEWFGAREDEAQTVTRHTVVGPGGAAVADVYEAWWADLSRFPGAIRSALIATLGMLLLATTVGAAALRGGGWIYGRGAAPAGGAPGQTSGALPRLGASLLNGIEWLVAVPILLIGAVHLALVGAGAFALARGGAQRGSAIAGMCAIAIGASLLVVWGARHFYGDTRFGATPAAALLMATAIGLVVWRTLAATKRSADVGVADTIVLFTAYPFRVAWMLVGVLGLVLVAVLLAWTLVQRSRDAVRRSATAMISCVGPFGLALLIAVLYAAAGAAIQTLATGWKWTNGQPWCLSGANDWQVMQCTPAAQHAFDWGLRLLQVGVAPMIYVAAAVLATTAVALLVVAAQAVVRSPRLPLGIHLARLMRVSGLTLPFAMPVGAVAVLLAWLPLGDHLLVWQQEHSPTASFRVLTSDFAVVTGAVVAGLFAAVNVLNLSVRKVVGSGKLSERVRLIVDLGYDIATYLREAPPGGTAAPRDRILDRFAGLLDHVLRHGGYKRVVFFTHSQGTVLATALLADPRSRLRMLDGTEVALLTMGTPLRHLYASRLCPQFSWVGELLPSPPQPAYVTRVDTEWINFGADGDLVGRTLFAADSDAVALQRGSVAALRLTPYPYGDWGVGPGGHGSYWTMPVVFEHLAALIV